MSYEADSSYERAVRDLEAAWREIAALKTELADARRALTSYGYHRLSCGIHVTKRGGQLMPVCTCGFTDDPAIAAARAAVPPTEEGEK